MGIILFNQQQNAMLMQLLAKSFRPLMGIILFNDRVYLSTPEIEKEKEFPSPNGDYFI